MRERKKYQITTTAFSKSGAVLSTAQNDYKRSHPLSKHFSLLAGESEHKDKLHSELAAVLQAGKSGVHSVLVQRFHNNGELANAKPCKACQLMLKAFGVRLVRYTTEDGIKEYTNV